MCAAGAARCLRARGCAGAGSHSSGGAGDATGACAAAASSPDRAPIKEEPEGSGEVVLSPSASSALGLTHLVPSGNGDERPHEPLISVRCGPCARGIVALNQIQYYNYSELVPGKKLMCSESNDILCKKTCKIRSQPYLT